MYNLFMKIIAITNQKGGVGKTTTAINMSACLAKKGKKILLLDLDPQANSTTGIGISKEDINYDIFDVLVNNKNINNAILKTTAEGVDIVPSSISLAGAEIYLFNKNTKTEKLFDLILEKVKNNYDYVIMDCPPSLGLINRNGLSSADIVIVPIQAEYYALEGLTQLLSTISLVKKMFNPKLKIGGILLTMFDTRTNLGKEVEEEVKKFFREKVFKTKIPRNIALAEAPSTGLSIIDYQINSKGAIAYMKLIEEFLSKKN